MIAKSAPAEPLLVLALPRGGVPVGFEVAKTLHASAFDIFLVRKLGVPGQEELAFGAIASGGVRVLNESLVAQIGITPETIDRIAEQERVELDRREHAYREGRLPLDPEGRTVILVDDGLATGATMLAAVQAVRLRQPAKIVVAVPVASHDARKQISTVADQVICADVPRPFYAVGSWYRDFDQVTDAQVRDLLRRSTTLSNTPHSVLQTNG